uniref:C2H2-type domain-containing protein n=1 Tax=Timema douglasi TaxID=61478 RepID=A0A7R8VF18_TIMDO|nr:unnamed protein product [Timema douglasi]
MSSYARKRCIPVTVVHFYSSFLRPRNSQRVERRLGRLHFRGGVPAFVWGESGKPMREKPLQPAGSNPNLPVFGSLVYCETSALDYGASEAGGSMADDYTNHGQLDNLHHNQEDVKVGPSAPPPVPIQQQHLPLDILTPERKVRGRKKGSTNKNKDGLSWAGIDQRNPELFGLSRAEIRQRRQGIKAYKCSHCNKAFANSSYLFQHNRIHLGIKPYICEICQRKFTQLSHLQQHTRTHTGEKPYGCQYPGCNKSFSQLSNLQSHSRSHQTDRPFKCNSCYKCFYDEPTLLEHIPRHIESKHLKTHICLYCGKSYSQEIHLTKHMQKHAERTNQRPPGSGNALINQNASPAERATDNPGTENENPGEEQQHPFWPKVFPIPGTANTLVEAMSQYELYRQQMGNNLPGEHYLASTNHQKSQTENHNRPMNGVSDTSENRENLRMPQDQHQEQMHRQQQHAATSPGPPPTHQQMIISPSPLYLFKLQQNNHPN